MNEKQFDKKIREALINRTDESVKMKKTVWSHIQEELKNSKEASTYMINNKSRRKPVIAAITSIAAVLVAVFFIGTGPGHVTAKKIKEFFVPQKNTTQQLEGQNEMSTVSLQESEAGYIIYIDEERYVMEKANGKDKIVPKAAPQGDYPEVYMEISQVKDKDVSSVTGSIQTELTGKYKLVQNEGTVQQPVNGNLLWAQGGSNWNDIQVKYYIVDNGNGGAFILKQQYFVEAAEGHGARFDNMLKEFKVQ